MTKPVIVTRAGKGSALTWTEGDTNLTNLRDATVGLTVGQTTVTAELNGAITLVAGSNVTLTPDSQAGTITVAASGGSSLPNTDNTPGVLTNDGSGNLSWQKSVGDIRFDFNGASGQIDTSYNGPLTILNNNQTGYGVVLSSNSTNLVVQGDFVRVGVYDAGQATTRYSKFNTDGTVEFPAFKFPATDGTNNQVLKTNGQGILTWGDAGGSLPSNAAGYLKNDGSGTLTWSSTGNDLNFVLSNDVYTANLTGSSDLHYVELKGNYTTSAVQLVFKNSNNSALGTIGANSSGATSLTGAAGNGELGIQSGDIYFNPGTNKSVYINQLKFPNADGSADQVLKTDGSGNLSWTTITSGPSTTDALTEGSTNLYYTDTRARAAFSAGTGISYNNTTGVISSSVSGTVTSVSGTGTVNGLTLTGTVTTSGSLTLGGTLSLVSPPAIGSTTPNTGAFTTLSANTTNTSQALSVTYTPSTTSGAAILATGKDSQGGVGYFDFLKTTNTTSGATNANKTFRTNSTGALEIINSGYTSTILSLTDAGALTVGGTTFPTSTGTSGQVLTANGSGAATWSTPSGGGPSFAVLKDNTETRTISTATVDTDLAFVWNEIIDPSGIVTVGTPSTSYFTLGAGTYIIRIETQGIFSSSSQTSGWRDLGGFLLMLYDYTNSLTKAQYYTGEKATYVDTTRTVEVGYGPAVITVALTLTASTTYKMRYRNYSTSKQIQAFNSNDKCATVMITKLA